MQFDATSGDAVQIGDVTVNQIVGSTRLIFNNSINLNMAKNIQYSIMKSSGSLETTSQPIPFNLKEQGTGDDAYKYCDLPVNMSGYSTGLYLMEIRLTDASGNLLPSGDKTISFRLLG
jgi:hypothetical protein